MLTAYYATFVLWVCLWATRSAGSIHTSDGRIQMVSVLPVLNRHCLCVCEQSNRFEDAMMHETHCTPRVFLYTPEGKFKQTCFVFFRQITAPLVKSDVSDNKEAAILSKTHTNVLKKLHHSCIIMFNSQSGNSATEDLWLEELLPKHGDQATQCPPCLSSRRVCCRDGIQ